MPETKCENYLKLSLPNRDSASGREDLPKKTRGFLPKLLTDSWIYSEKTFAEGI